MSKIKIKKGIPRKIRLLESDEPDIKKIAEVTKLSEVDIVSLAVSAGIRAIKENDYKMNLPLQFKVAMGTSLTNAEIAAIASMPRAGEIAREIESKKRQADSTSSDKPKPKP